MAFRTNDTAVKEILQKNYTAKVSLNPFITMANSLVNYVANQPDASNAASPVYMSSESLMYLEAVLACHFYKVSHPGYQQKTTGRASATYRGQTAKGLDYTEYGQQAKILDLTGALARKDWESQNRGRQIVQVMQIGDQNDHCLDHQSGTDCCW